MLIFPFPHDHSRSRSGFLPDTGLLLHHRPPATSETVRMETGFESGDEISVRAFPLRHGFRPTLVADLL